MTKPENPRMWQAIEMHGTDPQTIWDEAERHHADLVIDILSQISGDDLTASLEIARAKFEMTDESLWLRVCDGLLADLTQRQHPLFVPPPGPQAQDDIPF